MKTTQQTFLVFLSLLTLETTVAFADNPIIAYNTTEDVRAAIVAIDQAREARVIVDVPANSRQVFLGVLLADDPLGPEVEKVATGSAADRVGVVKGDHFVEIDNARVETIDDVKRAIVNHPPARIMKLTFMRNNRLYHRRLRIQENEVAGGGSDLTSAIAVAEVAELRDELQYVQRENDRLRQMVYFLLESKGATSE